MRTLALLAFIAPVAFAQSGLVLSDVRVPAVTVANHPFEAHVRVANDGTPRTVYLFAALYAPAEGKSCGPSTDPRFRAFTPLLQARLELGASQVVDYPEAGDSWLQQYAPEKVPAGKATMEWCVFAAEDSAAASAQLHYLAFESVKLVTRSSNAKPLALFTWSPSVPEAAKDVRFKAEGADQDGDVLSYHWDFGHDNASGRAVADGAEVTTFFFPAGTYPVTLRASDGFNETVVTQKITIAPEGKGVSDPTPPPDTHAKTPIGPHVILAAVAAAALLLRGRR